MTTIQAGAEPRTALPGGRGVRRSELTISSLSAFNYGELHLVKVLAPLDDWLIRGRQGADFGYSLPDGLLVSGVHTPRLPYSSIT
jgi:hypothetical protein